MRLVSFARIEILFNSWYRTLEFGPFTCGWRAAGGGWAWFVRCIKLVPS
jgi:hypothetical protein